MLRFVFLTFAPEVEMIDNELEPTAGEERAGLSCRPVACRLHCANGFAYRDGCPVCMCAEERESPLDGLVIPPQQCNSFGAVCQLYCENGFQTDENGCTVCACNES